MALCPDLCEMKNIPFLDYYHHGYVRVKKRSGINQFLILMKVETMRFICFQVLTLNLYILGISTRALFYGGLDPLFKKKNL